MIPNKDPTSRTAIRTSAKENRLGINMMSIGTPIAISMCFKMFASGSINVFNIAKTPFIANSRQKKTPAPIAAQKIKNEVIYTPYSTDASDILAIAVLISESDIWFESSNVVSSSDPYSSSFA